MGVVLAYLTRVIPAKAGTHNFFGSATHPRCDIPRKVAGARSRFSGRSAACKADRPPGTFARSDTRLRGASSEDNTLDNNSDYEVFDNIIVGTPVGGSGLSSNEPRIKSWRELK